ncbi:hypothetical protein [Plantactinospora sp. DSM 117369]
MDIAQVKATISRANEAANNGRALIQEVRDRAEQARTLADATAHDSSHKEVEVGLKKLREALKEPPRVAELLQSGAEAASEYASKL